MRLLSVADGLQFPIRTWTIASIKQGVIIASQTDRRSLSAHGRITAKECEIPLSDAEYLSTAAVRTLHVKQTINSNSILHKSIIKFISLPFNSIANWISKYLKPIPLDREQHSPLIKLKVEKKKYHWIAVNPYNL